MECMCAQTRPRFILSSERVWGEWSQNQCKLQGKNLLPEKNLPRGGSNLQRCIKQDSEPNTLPTSYSGHKKKKKKKKKLSGVNFSVSAQDGIVALGKVHTRSSPPLSSLPKVALETVPIFAWLNTDRSRPRRVECRPLPFSTPLSFRRSVL